MKAGVCTKTLQELADFIGAKLQGDPTCQISKLDTLQDAESGSLAFLVSRQYQKFLKSTAASAVVLLPRDAEDCPVNALITDNPRVALAKITKLFAAPDAVSPGIHKTAIIEEGCVIPASASIAAYVVIGKHSILGEGAIIGAGTVIGENCRIGDHTVIKPRVTLYSDVEIGAGCLIHSGVVLGADGFGFTPHEGQWLKMTHLASVVIGNNVEIGANTTIDRGFLKDTRILDGAIIDNLVQIAHNVVIGERTAIAGCTAIAGSVTIGADCQIGGGVNIAGHVNIGDKVFITGMSGIHQSFQKPGVYSGIPAMESKLWFKNISRFQYLDEMAKRLRKMESQLQPEDRAVSEDT